MSCERNRERFFKGVASAGSPAAQAFGSREEGAAALEDLFAVGRASTAAAVPAPLAEAQTRLLFAQMKRAGIAPPAHSTSGLPRADAQQGYALVQRTLTALGRGETLPEPSARLLAARGRQRQLAGQRADGHGQVRCGGCGQFASATRGHLCPRTATAAQLQRSLSRQLGVPPGAYPEAALETLLAEARAGPVTMRHAATGEQVQVTLDGLLPALRVGFLPRAWGAGKRVATANDQVVTVLESAGLAPAPSSDDPIVAAASASGLSLNDPAMVLGDWRRSVPLAQWLHLAEIRAFAAGAWADMRRVPLAVRMFLGKQAPRLAADAALPAELRAQARAVADLTFGGDGTARGMELLRTLAQGALAAAGGVCCERCGSWYEGSGGHACPALAPDPRLAAAQLAQEAAALGFDAGGQALIGEAVRLGMLAPEEVGPLLRLARAWAVLDDQQLTAGKIASARSLREQGAFQTATPEAALLERLAAEDDLASAVFRANAGERITRDQEQRLLALAGLPDREALRTHALAQEALWQERQRIVQRLHDETVVRRVDGGWEVTLPDGSATKVRTRGEAQAAHRQAWEAALAENGARGRALSARVRMLPLRWRDVLRAGGELPPPADDETTTEGRTG